MSRHVDGEEDKGFNPAFRPASPANSSDLELENVIPEEALQTQYIHKHMHPQSSTPKQGEEVLQTQYIHKHMHPQSSTPKQGEEILQAQYIHKHMHPQSSTPKQGEEILQTQYIHKHMHPQSSTPKQGGTRVHLLWSWQFWWIYHLRIQSSCIQ